MALLLNNTITLMDWAKRIDPNGYYPQIAELLHQTNEVIPDIHMRESNLPTGEMVVVRTGMPKAFWRAYNEKIPASSSQTAQLTEAIGSLEARSEIDEDIVKLNGNSAAFRLTESFSFLEGLSQEMARTLFYGDNVKDGKSFLGFAARYSSTTAPNGKNILKGGGSGSKNTSMYLIAWGDQTVYGVFPKGTTAGLTHTDVGIQTIRDGANAMRGYEDFYKWRMGLVVKDWRYVVRICNLDVEQLADQSGQQAPAAATALIKLMLDATWRIPPGNRGRKAFYADATVFSALSKMALDKSSAVLNVQSGLTQFGTSEQLLTFLGIPLRRCDCLVNNEPLVA